MSQSSKSSGHRRRPSSTSGHALFANSAIPDDDDKNISDSVQSEAELMKQRVEVQKCKELVNVNKTKTLDGVISPAPFLITGDPEAASDPEAILHAIQTEYPYDDPLLVDKRIVRMITIAMKIIPPDIAINEEDCPTFSPLLDWLERCKAVGGNALEEFVQNAHRYTRRLVWKKMSDDNSTCSICMYCFKHYFLQIEFDNGSITAYAVNRID